MSCFFSVFATTLRQRLTRLRGWVILLLIPFLLLCIRIAVPEREVAAPVQVGIALPADRATDLWQLLETRSGTVLTFIQSDPDTIKRNIAAGSWDCGVIVAEDFSQKIETLDTDRIFTVLVGDGSAVHPLVQETVASCMAALVSPHIAQKYLDSSGIAANVDSDQVQEKLAQILGADDRIIISMSTGDGASLAPFDLGANGIRTVLQWVVSAFVLVWLLLSTCDLGQWGRSNAVKRMLPLRSFTLLTAGHMAADWALISLSGCMAMIAIGSGVNGCIAVISYGFFWSAMGILLSRYPSLWESLPVLPPFAVVLSLLFSGALLDASAIVPQLATIARWFPGNLFLRICHGQTVSALPLSAAAALLLCICLLIDKIKKR